MLKKKPSPKNPTSFNKTMVGLKTKFNNLINLDYDIYDANLISSSYKKLKTIQKNKNLTTESNNIIRNGMDDLSIRMLLLLGSGISMGYYQSEMKEDIQRLLPGIHQTIHKILTHGDYQQGTIHETPNRLQAASAVSKIFNDESLKESVIHDIKLILSKRYKHFYRPTLKLLEYFPDFLIKEVILDIIKTDFKQLHYKLLKEPQYQQPTEVEAILLQNNCELINKIIDYNIVVDINSLLVKNYCSNTNKEMLKTVINQYILWIIQNQHSNQIACSQILGSILPELAKEPNIVSKELLTQILNIKLDNNVFITHKLKIFKLFYDIDVANVDVSNISEDDVKTSCFNDKQSDEIILKIKNMLGNSNGELDRTNIIGVEDGRFF